MSDTVTGSGFSVPSFDNDKPKTTRNPRTRAKQKAASKLIEAVDFLLLAADPKSPMTWQHHSRFVSCFGTSANGKIRAGHPIEEDLTLCPHLGMLQAALKKTGASIAMTPIDAARLSIAGGSAKFVVPCAPGESLPPIMFAPPIAPIDDRIKQGFAALLKLAKDEADTLHESTLLLRANTVVGCNGKLAMEYWHGNDLPPALNIPQAFAKAVVSVQKPLIGFGWVEDRSVTFHFEGGAWLATQLYEGTWPQSIDGFLNAQCDLEPCPAKLFEALDTIKDFSKDGTVHFHDDKLKTTYAAYADEQQGAPYGATYEVEGLSGLHSFSASLLQLAQPGCAEIDYKTHEDRMIFYNQEAWLRGVLMKCIA